MIQTMLITVLLYLIFVAAPAIVIGAVQVASLVGLTFILLSCFRSHFFKIEQEKDDNETKV